uniref:Uncharacterized protein n=1 Tax=Glyptapanteles flavicoxis TaxID=463051 RepID=B7S8J7_9HYME|nr:conserved hypothetical protein [Glyptapanteles flavicoxis]
MNEYQYLTSKIQVPKEWPVEAGRNMFIYVVQDAISHHELGQRTVLTIEKVSALVTSNKNTPGYLLEKIEKINGEDIYRIDLIMPVRAILLTIKSVGIHRSEEESVQCLPMTLRFDHPISQMFWTRSDRQKVVTAVPDLRKILHLKGITGPEMYNHALRTTYKIRKANCFNGIEDQQEPIPYTSAGPSTYTEQETDEEWDDVVFYDYLPPAQ